jgi:pyridoxal 5'-phosphate synthase pdxS subunit
MPRSVLGDIRHLQFPAEEDVMILPETSGTIRAVYAVHELGKLPRGLLDAAALPRPDDAALMMQLGVDGIFVGSAF